MATTPQPREPQAITIEHETRKGGIHIVVTDVPAVLLTDEQGGQMRGFEPDVAERLAAILAEVRARAQPGESYQVALAS